MNSGKNEKVLHKNYYAIIPANVRYDKELTPNAKLLYGEITALCNEQGYCWAGNAYFAELYNVSKKTISTWVNQLVSKRYITSEMIYKEGSNEIFHRYLRILHGGMEENVNTPMEENVKDNNTSFNNTFNNTSNKNISAKNSLVDDFDEWWNLYKKKKDKPNAERAFKRVVKKFGYPILKDKTLIYVQQFEKDNQYQKHPTSFLNAFDPDNDYGGVRKSQPSNSGLFEQGEASRKREQQAIENFNQEEYERMLSEYESRDDVF